MASRVGKSCCLGNFRLRSRRTISFSANPHSVSPVRLNVRTKHSKLNRALIAALLVEGFNFWVIGYPAATHPIFRLSQNPAVALQWYVLHLPGIIVSDHSIYLRAHAAVDSVVLFLAGYIDTVILLLAILWIAWMLARVRSKFSPVRRPA